MSNYVLYTDAAADIPAHYYDEYEIRTIPMDYLLNGKSITFYTESKERNRLCEELYKAQKEDADVHTSQITIYHYTEAWEKELEEGRDILYICFSSGLSSTYNNALVAASQLEEKYPERKIVVVDSLAGTTGQGIIVVLAAKDMAAGDRVEGQALAYLQRRRDENRNYAPAAYQLLSEAKVVRKGLTVVLISGADAAAETEQLLAGE